MADQLGTLVDNAVVEEGRLTQAFLQGLYADAGLTPNTPSRPLTGSQRMGLTSTAEAYARVPTAYRTHLSRGASHEEALDISMDRLRNMLATDLQMAHVEMTRRVATVNPKTTRGYRRILRPEMSRGNVCGLCIVAADRVYSISTLMPIHNGCNCDTAPIIGDFDPGINLNREDLDALYHAAGGDVTAGPALRQVKVSVYDHGETGPTMRPEGEHRQTPRRAFSRSKPENRPIMERPDLDAKIAQTERAIARLEKEIEDGMGDSLTSVILEKQRNNLSTLRARKAEQ